MIFPKELFDVFASLVIVFSSNQQVSIMIVCLKEIMDGQLGYESIDDSHPNPILRWERHAEAADDTEAELLEGKPPKV